MKERKVEHWSTLNHLEIDFVEKERIEKGDLFQRAKRMKKKRVEERSGKVRKMSTLL